MKKIFFLSLFQLSFLVGFSQTDTIAVVVTNDTIKQTYKNEIGVDIAPVFIKSMNLDRLNGRYSNTNSFNLFYKRNISANNYIRIGFNILHFNSNRPNVTHFNSAQNNNSFVFVAYEYNVNLNDNYFFLGYEKRFKTNYITPFVSVDATIGKYNSSFNEISLELYDTLNSTSTNIYLMSVGYDSTVVYSNGTTSLVKYEYSSYNKGLSAGLLFKAGFTVDLTKRFYLLMQTGGSIRFIIGESEQTYPILNPRKIYKTSAINFDLLQNQTNLMIGYRF